MVAIQRGGDDGRMVILQSGLLGQLPSGGKSVGVHDDETAGRKGVFELLYTVELKSERTIVGNEAPMAVRSRQASGDVANSGIAQWLPRRPRSAGDRSTPRAGERLMCSLDLRDGRIERVAPKRARGRQRRLRRGRPMTEAVDHDQCRLPTFLAGKAPGIATFGLTVQGGTDGTKTAGGAAADAGHDDSTPVRDGGDIELIRQALHGAEPGPRGWTG